MKTIIITAADAKYFRLSQGTILSVRDQPQGKDISIGYLDLGCTNEQLKWLGQHVDFIKKPEWHFDFPTRATVPEYLKGLLVRPFLREYFSEFDVYLWIDADAWVQDWKAIDLYIQGAVKRGLAITPELHRASMQQYGGLPSFWQWIHNQYKNFFGEEIAAALKTYPMLNAGIFALHKDAPHWKVWEELIQMGLQNCASIMTDQFALNLAVYSYGLFERTELLPAWCNWIFNGFPEWDQQNSRFVEPYLPHTPIGILHLAGNKRDVIQIKTIEGEDIAVYTHYQTNRDHTTNPITPNPNPDLLLQARDIELPVYNLRLPIPMP
jgi:hypothetical protein